MVFTYDYGVNGAKKKQKEPPIKFFNVYNNSMATHLVFLLLELVLFYTQWHIKYDFSLEKVFYNAENLGVKEERIPQEATRNKARLWILQKPLIKKNKKAAQIQGLT